MTRLRSPRDQAIDLAERLGACQESLAWLRSLPGDTSLAAIWHSIPWWPWIQYIGQRIAEEVGCIDLVLRERSAWRHTNASENTDAYRAVLPWPTVAIALRRAGLLPAEGLGRVADVAERRSGR